VFQVQPMPRFEQMMNSFAFDQGAGKNCAKDWRTCAWFETVDIDSAWKIEKFFFCHPALAKSLGRSFRKDEKQGGKVIFFDGKFRTQDKLIFPAPIGSAFNSSSRFGHWSYEVGRCWL